MPRRDISMTPDEVDAFFATCAWMVVGVIDDDGWPTATLARTTYDDLGLRVEFAAGDPVAVRLTDRSHLCCLADTHDSYYEIRGVIVHGRAVGDATATTPIPVALDRVISFDFGRLR